VAIQAEVEYLRYQAERLKQPEYLASTAGRSARHEIDQPIEMVDINVGDGRHLQKNNDPREFGMHESGFDLFKHRSSVDNFFDKEQLSTVYDNEIEALLKSITGCYRVHIFDHTVRASDPAVREQKNLREPSYMVHNDYTAKSGFVCLQENLGDDADALAQGRFQIINVWRPLVDPVEDQPLALCDARSLNQQDLIDTIRRAPNHIGSIQLAVHQSAHQWYYFPKMVSDEVLVFKTFDSIEQGSRPCSIHSAIKLSSAPANAKPRESVECRAFVFYR
jgi:hypothetical protein